jgi:DNA-binding response OmpR family regulator
MPEWPSRSYTAGSVAGCSRAHATPSGGRTSRNCTPAATTRSPPLDGATALHAIAADKPDLVILDLGLPAIDGVEVIRRLRDWTPVPIVILSGRLDSTQTVAALDAGADDYVTKPFSAPSPAARARPIPRSPPTSAGIPST